MPVVLLVLAALAVQPPAPQPFPRAGAAPSRPAPQSPAPAAPAPAPATPPPAVSVPPSTDAPPNQTMLGLPLYPGVQFLASYDAGRGQRYFLFGSTASFVEVVAFYRSALKQKGDLVFDAPATHEFDVGKFREDTMAFPPGVTVKDFQSQVSQGYPNPKAGGQPARFPTVIQIVPVQP
jgi:hypothetical protein